MQCKSRLLSEAWAISVYAKQSCSLIAHVRGNNSVNMICMGMTLESNSASPTRESCQLKSKDANVRSLTGAAMQDENTMVTQSNTTHISKTGPLTLKELCMSKSTDYKC